MHAHEVEAEAINMILRDPIFDALQHELPHHGLLRCRLVTASRAIAWFAILTETIEIVRERALEVAVVEVGRVVVHDIENHANASLMKSLHHLLELAHASGRVVRV